LTYRELTIDFAGLFQANSVAKPVQPTVLVLAPVPVIDAVAVDRQ
jgi:hypothetical protein